MNKKIKIIVSIFATLAIVLGVYFFKYQDSVIDFIAGCLIGIGCGSLVSIIIVKTKSDFDKANNNLNK